MAKRRRIEVVPYDARWGQLYRAEAEQLAAVLGEELLAIHHIGSTAVPGCWAKPIVDILPVVRQIERVDSLDGGFEAIGYQVRGEYGLPGRRYFIKPSETERHFHVHIWAKGHPDIERHLRFRDYLRSHPEDAEDYSALKQRLAREFRYDSQGYVGAKEDFIAALMARADF